MFGYEDRKQVNMAILPLINSCPNCHGDLYQMESRRVYTIFGIPFLPTVVTKDKLKCNSCDRQYSPTSALFNTIKKNDFKGENKPKTVKKVEIPPLRDEKLFITTLISSMIFSARNSSFNQQIIDNIKLAFPKYINEIDIAIQKSTELPYEEAEKYVIRLIKESDKVFPHSPKDFIIRNCINFQNSMGMPSAEDKEIIYDYMEIFGYSYEKQSSIYAHYLNTGISHPNSVF